VRVHTGAAAEEAADSIGAKAFAKGSDIVFAKGEYNPNTAEGRGLIGHELAHVAQNATGVHRAPKEGEKEKSWYERLSDKVEDTKRRSRRIHPRRAHQDRRKHSDCTLRPLSFYRRPLPDRRRRIPQENGEARWEKDPQPSGQLR
ncbi:MAG: DUF4157 domain-containing protein, partial [Leptonema illini]